MTEDVLVQAVLAAPDDNLARLAYADWCEEQGTEDLDDRAEYIRLAVRQWLDHREGCGPLQTRISELHLRVIQGWVPELMRANWVRPRPVQSGWERGFLAHVHAGASLAEASLCARHPVTSLRLDYPAGTGIRADALVAVIGRQAFERLRVLDMKSCELRGYSTTELFTLFAGKRGVGLPSEYGLEPFPFTQGQLRYLVRKLRRSGLRYLAGPTHHDDLVEVCDDLDVEVVWAGDELAG